MASIEESDYWYLNEPLVFLVDCIRHESDVAEGIGVMEIKYSERGKTAEAIEPGGRENARRGKGVIERVCSDELRRERVA